MGLLVNNSKTELMHLSKNLDRTEYVEINEARYGVSRNFKYLGSMINDQNQMDIEIKARIAAANRCY